MKMYKIDICYVLWNWDEDGEGLLYTGMRMGTTCVVTDGDRDGDGQGWSPRSREQMETG